MFTDRNQHSRYLTYLKKYEYFGRGKARLTAEQFVALEAEFDSLRPGTPEFERRRREIRILLLRD